MAIISWFLLLDLGNTVIQLLFRVLLKKDIFNNGFLLDGDQDYSHKKKYDSFLVLHSASP